MSVGEAAARSPLPSGRIMHPPRRKRTTSIPNERTGVADRLTDWLLRHCPFTSLTVLTLLVIGSAVSPTPRRFLLVVPIMADALINLGRWGARQSRRSRPADHRWSATA
jgi:hypothetical protein